MVPLGIADVAPWPDWRAAAEGALAFLAEHVGWDLWMVTQVVEDRQVVLLAHPDRAVRPGLVLPWERSFCRQMVEGSAPRLATVTAAVPEYASRTTGPLRDIAAYVGIPLLTRDLQLFGTLCGVAYRAKPRSAARELSVVEAAARMLSTLMAAGWDPPPLPGEPDREVVC
ncbi:histidine kinase [Blastococcus sp. MG754426]|uniref:histidine kinase n=1 Tax=unclassified Blastococcus TaxID=2619396 RepID=UPI001EF13C36|nr:MULTISPECIES: histidine kinase [unclassified Blastococcus]MCF6506767.1 histidine kinase [Blastococcus sp. MG754426]MCF6511338.1 histidine kinase [Blastococcus sp. MG754427]MCF6734793.1 histidine kinase [Blastococcus sp. KM273129]